MRASRLAIPAFLFLIASAGDARADAFHLKDDKELSVGSKIGFFHVSDSRFDATWTQPVMVDLNYSFATSRRGLFNRLQVYGLVIADFADLSYEEDPFNYSESESLAGIHRAKIHVPLNLTLGAGARITLVEAGDFHLHLLAEYAMTVSPASVDVETLVVDINGLQVDVAPAARKYADVTFDWRTMRVGATAGYILRFGCRRRATPYLTVGAFNYRATFAFEVSPAFEEALRRFQIDPVILEPRTVTATKPYAMIGARIDMSPNWGFDVNFLAGKIDGTWLYSGHAGVTWRRDFLSF